MHIWSWHGNKAYSTLEKFYTTLKNVVYYFPGVKEALSPNSLYAFFEAIDLYWEYSEGVIFDEAH
jgi:hypothetical protein